MVVNTEMGFEVKAYQFFWSVTWMDKIQGFQLIAGITFSERFVGFHCFDSAGYIFLVTSTYIRF